MNTILSTQTSGIGQGFSKFVADVVNAFSGFNIFNAIDILVLTLIFLFVFSFIKSRKAGALFIGIIVCLALSFGAMILGLEGTFFIFSGVFQIGALAFVIIFQPEIRDGLERLGSGSISGLMHLGSQSKKKQAYSNAINHICAAVAELAHTKTGALIVIQRTTKLEDIIQTGVTINADVNSSLLRNLFFNKAPLHDGAVVIDDEAHIVAAGCLLPLTRRQDINSDLGTRHRAAIGMSETSDAIIVVVSEETGIISVASQCELTRNYTVDALRGMLSKILLRQKDS